MTQTWFLKRAHPETVSNQPAGARSMADEGTWAACGFRVGRGQDAEDSWETEGSGTREDEILIVCIL